MNKKNRIVMVLAIIILMVVLDQALKIFIKTHFHLGEMVEVIPNFFYLTYVLNDGMAFGIEWFDKLALTLFRLVAIGALGWYVNRILMKARVAYLATIAFIIAGALGNIIDCVFYGPLFGDAPWFYGKVVDMFSFTIFPPVFNLADSCITCAVIAILIWFRKDLDTSLS